MPMPLAGRDARRAHGAGLSIAALILLASTPSARADDPKDHSTNLGVNNFGNLQQQCGFDKGGCAPTAATNSFTYLENTVPFVGHSLTGGDELATQAGLAQAMSTDANGSTFILNFIQGKQTWFDQHNVRAHFAAQVDPQLLTPAQVATAGTIPGTTVGAPTGLFMANELHDHEDVEMLANGVKADGTVDPTVGHYVTLVDLNWYDQDGNGLIDKSDWQSASNHASPTFGYMDPNGGVFRDGIGLLTQGGHLALIGPSTGALFYITGLVSESPVKAPEPATWALMLAGFTGVGVALRAHRRRRTAPSKA